LPEVNTKVLKQALKIKREKFTVKRKFTGIKHLALDYILAQMALGRIKRALPDLTFGKKDYRKSY
jgi:hypothetical protein